LPCFTSSAWPWKSFNSGAAGRPTGCKGPSMRGQSSWWSQWKAKTFKIYLNYH
jgi:hypothetical protein